MDYLSLALVSAAVSGIVQVLKKYVKLPGDMALIGVSLVAAVGYFLLKDSSLWNTFLTIVLVANGIYGLLIQRFE